MIQWVIAVAAAVVASLLAVKWAAVKFRKAARGISTPCDGCPLQMECSKKGSTRAQMLNDGKPLTCDKAHTTASKLQNIHDKI